MAEKDVDQAITALKRGAYLLKYGRRGKPKFCPFRLSPDESRVIWYYGKEEKHLNLRHVTRIIPGQRTAIFKRYPRPEKEYQSFSLLYNDRSLDLICKDKDEAEVWFMCLKTLITRNTYLNLRHESTNESTSELYPPSSSTSSVSTSTDVGDTQHVESLQQRTLGKAFADIVSFTAPPSITTDRLMTSSMSSLSLVTIEKNANVRTSASDAFRVSLSSAVSSSSHGSCHGDSDTLNDVFIWGELSSNNLPKQLDSSVLLDVQSIACGNKHVVLVTKEGEIYSWGEEAGGWLGHGVGFDISQPKLIKSLTNKKIETAACGEFHTCALTASGDIYTWGDTTHHSGLLGHGSETGSWIPKKVDGLLQGLQVSYVSCGLWHTALITSEGRLFTFGDGTFGVLGHGDHQATNTPREVECLKGMRTLRVACGVWHTAAIVGSGNLFTWGDGDKGQLGHGDNKSRLVPERIASVDDVVFSQVACGDCLTVGLATNGHVYTMGSNAHGKLGNPTANGKTPTCLNQHLVQQISCGLHHVAVLTTKSEVYTWGKGLNGQLGHGDYIDQNTPTLVESLKHKQVKSVVCGSNFTSVICVHKIVSGAENSACSGCHNPFTFTRKQHNCYNCGLVFCTGCTSRKATKASLAPDMSKPYRVCDDCFTKLLQKPLVHSASKIPKVKSTNLLSDFGNIDNSGPSLRLSSADSYTSSKSNTKLERNDKWMVSPPNTNSQRGSISFPKLPTGLFGTSKFLSTSVPNSRTVSRSVSPLPRIETPYVADVMFDESKLKSDEIKDLRAQIEELVSKSQLLKTELENKTRQVKEAKEVAADEAEKGKAANKVINSLTQQLKAMAKESTIGINGEEDISVVNRSSNGSNITSVDSLNSESNNESLAQVLTNGTKTSIEKFEKSEQLIHDIPGVYITLCSLPNGANELKRVRFSRKRFTEQQAQRWWAENGTKMCQQYNIKTV